jgi:hemerythrin-like metal-binding protein
MATLKWNDSLSVGNRQIDDDHKHLFALLGRLQDAMKVGQANAVLAEILDELVRYTAQHFRREEQHMQRIGYADYAAHKGEHDRLIAEVTELQARFKNGSITLSLSVYQFLNEWLNKHIMTSDAALAKALG